jgi:hypothetical protein
MNKLEPAEYSKKEQNILDYLSKKYDIHIDDVIDAFEA